MAEFEGKKVLITGGTKGLGFAVAKMLAAQRAELFLGYRSDHAHAEKSAATLRELGGKIHLIQSDLTEDAGIDKLWSDVAAKTDRLDVYLHNAAATAFKPLMDIKPHHVDRTMNLTVKSLIIGAQRAAALMKDGGAIVTVSGMDTLKAVPYHGLLGAAKSALETLTGYLAHELAEKKIRVNGVNPGFLDTDSTRKYAGEAFDMVMGVFSELVPLKRVPNLDEIAEVILFLASKKSSWVCGQTINVDGGLDFALPAPAF